MLRVISMILIGKTNCIDRSKYDIAKMQEEGQLWTLFWRGR